MTSCFHLGLFSAVQSRSAVSDGSISSGIEKVSGLTVGDE